MPMTEDDLVAAVKLIAESLKADLTESIAALDKKCDSLSEKMKKADEAGTRDRGVDTSMRRRGDEDADPVGEQRNAARRTAADHRSDSIDPAAFSALVSTVADMKKKQSRPMGDLNAYADAQSKADAVMRAHAERAEPPMAGEDIIAYNIRLHRPMQKHSAKWKAVDLGIISADRKAFDSILGEIRSDAYQAGLNPVGLEPFQYREMTQEMPGGHKVRTFHGNGTIFKQLSRPVRHVAYIGTRNGIATGRPYATS
jgi:hypothetical protein